MKNNKKKNRKKKCFFPVEIVSLSFENSMPTCNMDPVRMLTNESNFHKTCMFCFIDTAPIFRRFYFG